MYSANTDPTTEELAAQCDKICEDEIFRGAAQVQSLFKYLIKHKAPKAFQVAQHVLGLENPSEKDESAARQLKGRLEAKLVW